MILETQETLATLQIDQKDAMALMNHYGRQRMPFLFIIPFDKKKCSVLLPEEVNPTNLQYNFDGFTNTDALCPGKELRFEKEPLPYPHFLRSFNQVKSEINRGNSYLINLTFQTSINTNYTLEEIFQASTARYKLLCNDFVVFSPETFVKITDGIISSYPMKGTIDASIPSAEKIILEDAKESAEHATIVDLIRNDLSIIATNVQVKKYRYIDRIITHEKELLQVSSKVTGRLAQDYRKRLGTIIFSLLPAGSICGAPKAKTVSIINQVENHTRGPYTGICGYFDGSHVDSGVMIRYIERQGSKYVFKSGGGITSFSNPLTEYQEYIDKVYVPIH